MDSREFTEWLAFYQLEPFGPQRDDARIGVLGAGLAQLLADFKGRPPKPEVFMPRFTNGTASSPTQTAEDTLQKMILFTKAHGGTVNYG